MRIGAVNSTQVNSLAYRGPRVLAAFGDSISAQGFGGNLATGYTAASVGFATWAAYLSRRRVELVPGSNQGVSGETSAQILARVGNVLALRPGVCTVLAGTNDIGTLTPAQTIANLTAIYDALRNAGIFVIAIPILPRGSLSATEYGKIQQVNVWIRLQRNTRRNFAVADCEQDFIDLATGTPKTTMVTPTVDLTHPNVYGAYTIGNKVAGIINAVYPDPLLPFMNRLDVYDATLNPGGNLLAGSVGLTEGTTGTLTNGPTGQLATSWSANGVNLPAGVTVTFAKVVKADGREFVQATIQGTYTHATPPSFNITAPSCHPNVAAGQTVEMVGESEVDAGSTLLGAFFPLIDVATPSGNPVPQDMIGNYSNLMPPVAVSGINKTFPVTMPATPTLVRPTYRIVPAVSAGGTINAVVRFGSVSLRKV